MFTKKFWMATLERAISTGAETLLAVTLVGDTMFNVFDMDWQLASGYFLGGTLIAVLKALVAQGISGKGPGFGNSEALAQD